MIRKILIISLLLFINFAFAKNIQGKITYTEEVARTEAFKDLPVKIPKALYKNYLKDKHYKENYLNLKNKNYEITTEPKRYINPFLHLNSIVLYSVEYDDDMNKKFYYNILGHLVKFEMNDYGGSYPYRAIAYDKKGNVINITYIVSQTEAFIFDKNEKLLGHWSDNQFYDNKGKGKLKRILE